MKNKGGTAPRAVLLLGAIAAIAAIALLTGASNGPGGGPTPADASCGSLKVQPEVVSKFPKVFANQYTKKMRISVNRGRSHVKHWRVELYTFGGFLLGKSNYKSKMSSSDKIAMKLRLPMQPGKYTLVVKGDVAQVRGARARQGRQLPRLPEQPADQLPQQAGRHGGRLRALPLRPHRPQGRLGAAQGHQGHLVELRR